MKYDAEDVIREHVALLKEISELRGEITMLRDQENLVREAIERFVSPDMLESACEWLRIKGM